MFLAVIHAFTRTFAPGVHTCVCVCEFFHTLSLNLIDGRFLALSVCVCVCVCASSRLEEEGVVFIVFMGWYTMSH